MKLIVEKEWFEQRIEREGAVEAGAGLSTNHRVGGRGVERSAGVEALDRENSTSRCPLPSLRLAGKDTAS